VIPTGTPFQSRGRSVLQEKTKRLHIDLFFIFFFFFLLGFGLTLFFRAPVRVGGGLGGMSSGTSADSCDEDEIPLLCFQFRLLVPLTG